MGDGMGKDSKKSICYHTMEILKMAKEMAKEF
jgi:hypothetical protein